MTSASRYEDPRDLWGFVFDETDAVRAGEADEDRFAGAEVTVAFPCPISGGLCRIALGRPGRKPSDPADVLCSRPRCRFHAQSVNGGELTC